MFGKILKISSNDLYGNVDDRKVTVFAAFNHLKYMNKYVIFSFTDEYNKKKLYFGSLHLKDASIVVFSIKDNTSLAYVKHFIDQYIGSNVDKQEFEMIDISSFEKIELVAYNDMDFDNLELLDKLSIKRDEPTNYEDNAKKKPIFLYFLLIFLIVISGGLTYLYFNPDAFEVKLKKLNCNMEGYNKKVELAFKSEIEVKFDKEDKLKDMNKVDIYLFDNGEDYFGFKDNQRENELSVSDGGYKYDDENYELRIISKSNIIINEYNELKEYLKSEGYSCIEEEYNE